MVDFIPTSLESVVYGFAVLLISFIVLSVAWGLILKFIESLFSKSKLYFIPKILSEVSNSALVLIFLLSAYFGITTYDMNMMDGVVIKIWGILLIIAATDIVVRLILSTLDIYYIKSKRASSFISGIILSLKRVVGLILYAIAIILIINFISVEVGSVLANIGLLIVILLFVVYYEQLKNVVAGLQLLHADLREGDYIEVMNKHGFIERILTQYIVLRDKNGRRVVLPNSLLVKYPTKNHSFSDGNLVTMKIKISDQNSKKSKKRLLAVSGKSALSVDGVLKDYKPKVYLSEIEDGASIFILKFIISQNTDLMAVADTFAENIKDEFKDRLKGLKVE